LSFLTGWKQGEDFVQDDTVIPNNVLTIANKPGKTYAYCADTVYTESIADKVKNVDLLYHETTYLKDKSEKAKSRFHSTTVDAATFAKIANAKVYSSAISAALMKRLMIF
jgi:ribonuclease Z